MSAAHICRCQSDVYKKLNYLYIYEAYFSLQKYISSQENVVTSIFNKTNSFTACHIFLLEMQIYPSLCVFSV